VYAWGAETTGSTIPPVVLSITEFPPFRLDLINQYLWRRSDKGDEQRIPLPPKAFAMLRCMVQHAGRLVTQDELLETLWPETYVQPEVLKSHVREIRAALGDDPKNAELSLQLKPTNQKNHRTTAHGLAMPCRKETRLLKKEPTE